MHVQTSTTKCNSLPFCRYRTIFKGVIYHVIARKFLRSNFLIVLGQNNIWNLCLQHFALVETLHMLPTSSLVCKQKKRVFEQERSHILTSTFFRLFLCVEVHSIQQVSVWREETLFIQNQINFEHFPSHKTSANFRRRKKQPWTTQQYSWLPTWAISLIQCSEGMHILAVCSKVVELYLKMATMRIPEVEKTEMKTICNYSSYEIPVVLCVLWRRNPFSCNKVVRRHCALDPAQIFSKTRETDT